MFDLHDRISSASHLLTAVWAVFATLVMLRMTASRPARLVPILVYGISMVLLFSASGTFHGLRYDNDEQKRFFQKLDQSAVYMLIAGTYTPVLAILLEGTWRKTFLALVWLLAFAGIASLWLLPKAPHTVIVGLYVGLGWAGLPPVRLYYRAVGWRAMNWVWLGGGLYTLGAVCEVARWPVIVPNWIQAHEVLHLCDSAAGVAFFLFIVRHVIPYRAAQPAQTETLHVAA